MAICFGRRSWDSSAETQAPGTCVFCGNALPEDGKHYCPACHVVPGGEIDAERDDRVPKEEQDAPEEPKAPVTVGDTNGVEIRKGIRVPKKYAKLAGV